MINPSVYHAVLQHNETMEFIPVVCYYDDDPYDDVEWYIHDESFMTEDEAWTRAVQLKDEWRNNLIAEDDPVDRLGVKIKEKEQKRVLDYD